MLWSKRKFNKSQGLLLIPPASYRVLGAVPLGEGGAENAAGGWSEGKASPSYQINTYRFSYFAICSG